jgi:GNAT superfamily N-acetyltransferase
MVFKPLLEVYDGVAYQREFAHELWGEIMPLLVRHKDEIAHFKDIELNPDVEAYNRCEEQGVLRCFTARSMCASYESGELMPGVLVGYAVYFVRPNPHFKDSLQASQDVLFILPEYRRGRIGLRLIEFADQVMKAEGVQAVYQHVKVKHDFSPLLERLGYELVDRLYARRLD